MAKVTTPNVKGIIVLDSEGNRVYAKYYDQTMGSNKDKAALEKKIYAKTKNSNPRMEADIVLIENIVSVYRSGADVTMHVIGSSTENEVVLLHVLEAAFDAVSTLLKGRMERMVMLDNIEMVLLTFDEVVDGGVILEADSSSIVNRVLMRGINQEVPVNELTISQAFASAREQFSRSFRG